MTNFEKYKDEILEIAEAGSCCIALRNGKPVKCESMPGCSNCELNTDGESGCQFGFLKWAYEDDDADCSPDAGKPNSAKGGCEGCHYQGNHILNLPCCHCERAIIDCFEPKKKPKKTRQSEFLKMYPNARLNSKGILDIRPCNIDTSYSTDHCYFACGDECQSNYWLQEVEE